MCNVMLTLAHKLTMLRVQIFRCDYLLLSELLTGCWAEPVRAGSRLETDWTCRQTDRQTELEFKG